jgi:tetrahydromethanopterin S-methyltransferase subunit D
MGDGFVSLMFGAGFGTWVYSKLMKNTMNQKNSLIGGAVAGIGGCVVLYTLVKFTLHISM